VECKKQERLFENTYITVDVNSKKILSMNVTADEHDHDSKTLSELVKNTIKSNNVTIRGKQFADDAYDYNDIFRCISDNGIHLCPY
jgi:hypothetical protein